MSEGTGILLVLTPPIHKTDTLLQSVCET